jgi:hypothetical protein
MQENNPPETGDGAPMMNGDAVATETIKPLELTGHGKSTPDEPRAVGKKPLADIPMYPSVKAQSLPIQAQTLKERNKRVSLKCILAASVGFFLFFFLK